MKIELTPEEQEHLIWQEGDYFESVRGVITFTAEMAVRAVVSDEKTTERTFFFKDTEGRRGEVEWTACIQKEMPNGPAQMILLKRGDRACVFGIISLVNGAWAPVWPLTTIYYYRKSSRRLRLLIWGKLAIVPLLLVWPLVLFLTLASFGLWSAPFNLFSDKLSESWRGLPNTKKRLEGDRCARSLMHRLASSAASLDRQTQGRL